MVIKMTLYLVEISLAEQNLQDLYLWLNNTKNLSVGGGTQIIDWDGGDTDQINLTTNLGSYDVK